MLRRHSHNTRLTPERPPHGGRRPGAGRPAKESKHPNSLANLSALHSRQNDEKKESDYLKEQIQQLANPKGQSWSCGECALILTLLLNLMLQHKEIPTQAMERVSSLTCRSYKTTSTMDKMER